MVPVIHVQINILNIKMHGVKAVPFIESQKVISDNLYVRLWEEIRKFCCTVKLER